MLGKKIRIQMVCGTYGLRGGNGVMEEKSSKSGPFEVEQQEGERLIRKGYAERTGESQRLEEEYGNGQPEDGGARGFVEELEKMEKKDLERIAKDMGLPVKGTKNELVQRILGAEESRRGDGEGTLRLEAAEPEG